MIEPDFGESQFQQLFNDELKHKLPGSGIQPIIPTQPEEKNGLLGEATIDFALSGR